MNFSCLKKLFFAVTSAFLLSPYLLAMDLDSFENLPSSKADQFFNPLLSSTKPIAQKSKTLSGVASLPVYVGNVSQFENAQFEIYQTQWNVKQTEKDGQPKGSSIAKDPWVFVSNEEELTLEKKKEIKDAEELSLSSDDSQNLKPANFDEDSFTLLVGSKEDEEKVYGLIPSHPASVLKNVTSLPKETKLASNKLTLKNEVVVSFQNDQLGFKIYNDGKEGASIQLDLVAQPHVSIRFEPEALKEEVHLFVRNKKLGSYDRQKNIFIAKEKGQSELILTKDDSLVILPLVIKDGKADADALVSSDSNNGPHPVALMASFDDAIENTQEESTLVSQEDHFSEAEVKKNPKQLLTFDVAKKQVEEKQQNDDQLGKELVWHIEDMMTTSLSFQGVHEYDKSMLPVSDLSLQIVGTDIKMKTTSNGLTPVVDVPKNSRLLVMVDDPLARFYPSTFEVTNTQTSQEGPIVEKLSLITYEAYNTLTQIAVSKRNRADQALKGDEGSVCLLLKDDSEVKLKKELSYQILVEEDQKASPLYFDDFGFVDTTGKGLALPGRVCFFGLSQGPATIRVSLSNNQQVQATFPVNIFANRHTFQQVDLHEKLELLTTPVVASSAGEQIFDANNQNFYKPVDWADLYLFGGVRPFASKEGEYGLLTQPHDEEAQVVQSKTYYLSYSPQFEQMLYSFDVSDQTKEMGLDHTTVLLPKGFMRELAFQTQQPLEDEFTFGNVYVEHGRMGQESKEETGSLLVQLYDGSNKKVSNRPIELHNGDGSISKSFFINLTPGMYSLVVSSEKGHWLASKTVLVYSETTSYVRTGSELVSLMKQPEKKVTSMLSSPQ